MPRLLLQMEKRPVATERELLNFANKIREAGGAKVLDALLPSVPSDSHGCLIAQALNFNCAVYPWNAYREDVKYTFADGSDKWVMVPERGSPEQSAELTKDLAKKLKLRLLRHATGYHYDAFEYALQLPRHIGNAASAFDNGWAFEKYDKRRILV